MNNPDLNGKGAIPEDSSFFYHITPAKNGSDTLTLNEKSIHSKFKPDEEASAFIKSGKNLILIFGCGLGYPLFNIAQKNPQSLIIALEPVKPLSPIINKRLAALNLINHDQILIINSCDRNAISRFLEDAGFLSEGRLHTYSNPGYHSLLPELESDFFTAVKTLFQSVIQNVMTESSFISLWSKNLIRNLNHLTDTPLPVLRPAAFQESLCIIACAGPSLYDDLDWIKKYRDKITLFAVDTAIKTLYRSGIHPDLVISLDGQFYSLDDFYQDDHEETAYIFDIIAYPQAQLLVKKRYYTVNQNLAENQLTGYFLRHFNLKLIPIETGGTVSDYAMNLAILLGFKHIYFSGLDLSFPRLLTHSPGTPFYDRLHQTSGFFETIQTLLIKTISRRSIKTGESRIHTPLLTDFVLENYCHYFSETAHQYSHLSFYCKKTDALNIPGFKNELPDEILFNSARIRHFELFPSENLLRLDRKSIQSFKEDLLNRLFNLSEELKFKIESSDFNQENSQSAQDWQNLFQSIFKEYPFLKKFILMTHFILEKKGIGDHYLLYYKHTGFKLLQSIYFLIRTLQKSLKYPD